LILLLVANGISQEILSYLFFEIRILVKSIIYILIWYLYFKNSIRISIYYNEKTLEQILQNPKKGYQVNFVNKSLMEFKIIQYFKKQKALDYASGIYINKLPREYANSISLQDLNAKKIIRLKKAKYYLNNKNLENPKTEPRKTAKTIAWMVTIYILVLIILNTL
ncbi:MAG: hypothetical protein HFJ27_02330, partial [Clostridia bacterium]|nr:hypothetical protein [Clostridia bacterium]